MIWKTLACLNIVAEGLDDCKIGISVSSGWQRLQTFSNDGHRIFFSQSQKI